MDPLERPIFPVTENSSFWWSSRLPEEGNRAGTRNIVHHWSLYNRLHTKKEETSVIYRIFRVKNYTGEFLQFKFLPCAIEQRLSVCTIHINLPTSNGHAAAVGSRISPQRRGHDFGASLFEFCSGTSGTVAEISPSTLVYPTSATQPILQTRIYTTTTVFRRTSGQSLGTFKEIKSLWAAGEIRQKATLFFYLVTRVNNIYAFPVCGWWFLCRQQVGSGTVWATTLISR